MSQAAAPAPDPAPRFAERFRQRILHGYFVRFHMGLILTAVTASGVLTSKLLLELQVRSLRLRYPIAVLSSYLVFLLLVRIWIWYVSRRQRAMLSFDPGSCSSSAGSNWSIGGGSSSSGGGSVEAPFRFSGGESGGGGAGGSWETEPNAVVVPAETSSGSHGSSLLSGLDFSCGGDDDWVILLLLALLVVVICCAGGYLVWAAPEILPEAAWQALLASTLTRVSKDHHHGWMPGVMRATAIPFTLVLIVSGVLGWEAHKRCPQASRLIDAVRCSQVYGTGR